MEIKQLLIITGAIGLTEYLLIAVVLLVLFGGRKIPELMKGLGQGIKEFKKASQGDNEHKETADKGKEGEQQG